MSLIIEGGDPHTTCKSVGTSATLLVAARPSNASPYRSGFTIQNIGSVDVYIGGSDVVATTSADDKTGILLIAQASATVQPSSFSNASSNRAYYGIVASGTGKVVVLEEY